MQKLESLKSFEALQINKDASRKIIGGLIPPDGGTETGAGTTCVSTSLSASGCCSYSSDYVHENGNWAWSPTNGTIANSDVNNPC
jgi:hypothetical protein